MARRKEIYSYIYTYRETRHSKRGIAALILGLVSFGVLAALTALVIMALEVLPEWVGAAGFTGFAFAFFGMIQGLMSFHDNCKSYFFSRVGTICCAVMVAAWFMIFCVGLAQILG